MIHTSCRKCGNRNLVGGWDGYVSMCIDCGYEWPPPEGDEVAQKTRLKRVPDGTVEKNAEVARDEV